MLDSYRKAIKKGWSDQRFVELVEQLDQAIVRVEGHGFEITPLTRESALGAALGLGSKLWVKDETGNVGGSHKGRHLFGTLLHLAIDEVDNDELVIASCGNAAVAAAVVARAAERPLRVYVPTWADPVILEILKTLGAQVVVSKRKGAGDPTVAALAAAVAKGSVPFSVQGPLTPSTIDGGRTLGWELAEQLALARIEGTLALFVQVGGGALAASVWQGLNNGIQEQWLAVTPTLMTVQTEAVAPLNRAWSLVLKEDLDTAAHEPDRFMWPWEEMGTSVATGILDDVTYDWLPVVGAMISSGGTAHVIPESLVSAGHRTATDLTGIKADPTGTAGVAALMDPTIAEEAATYDHVVVLLTGRQR